MSRLRRYQQNPKIPARQVGGVLAVITPGSSEIHRLNPMAAMLWQLCAGEGHTVPELVSKVVERYDVEIEQAREDVREFVEDAHQKNILLCID